MTLKAIRRRGQCAVIAACACAFIAGRAFAGISLDGASTVKIAHYAEENNTAAKDIITITPPSSGSMPIPSSYQLDGPLTLGAGMSSDASASIGAITTSQNVGFTFASGTGVTQTDTNPGGISGPAILRFDLNGIWNTTSGGFGPTAYAYLAFTVAGTIPTGDTASISINMTWKDELGNNLRNGGTLSQTLSFTHTSTLPQSFASAAVLNSGVNIPSGKKIKVAGSIAFRAKDPGATIDLHPTDFELSAAPATYRYLDKSANISDPTNWANDMALPSAFPTGAGVRAYIGPNSKSSTDISLNVPVTLGMVDINRGGLNLGGNSTLTFDTQANNAVLFVRNVNNFTGTVNGAPVTATPTLITAPIVLNKDLDVMVDTEQPAMANGPISGVGGIVKGGLGNLQLGSPNTFTGGIIVNGGVITPTVNGALGSNTVTLNGGMINVQTPQPFAPGGGTIATGSGGQVNIGMNGITGVNYSVATFGAISGNAQQLGSLVIGGNYFPKPNSMISHQTFDTTVGSSNPQNLTNSPTYIFGISNDFTSANQNITVGSASGTPWSGFGSDLSPHTFGGGANQFLGINGAAQLVALGGQLKILAPITGTGQIIKNGPGLVSINNAANTFNGSTEVQSGPMAVNAGWAGPITVDPGGSLGGTGTVGGPITFIDSATNPATFQPGMLGSVANNATSAGNSTITGPGTLHTGGANFTGNTHLIYDFNTPNVAGGADNDLLAITGNLVLDGILDIHGGPDFTGGTYTLMTFTGNLTNNGLILGNVPLDDFPNMQVIIQNNSGGTGGSVLLSVPEPGSIGAIAVLMTGMIMRRRQCVA